MKKRQLIGIINCTPDSYFERGRFTEPQEAIDYGLQLIEEGADILDIGGESTRPMSPPVSEEEEIKRVIPVIKGIRQKTACLLSVDTFKPSVARQALDEGVDLINDITALSHPDMQKLVHLRGVKCCIMHMCGPPHTEPNPSYPKGVLEEVSLFLKQRIQLLLNAGIKPSQIILDPGIGGGAFGKSPNQNLYILKNIKSLLALGYPILVSLSRKSFMQKILQKQASELLSTTLALNTIALLEGAAYIRVHDVAAHRDILTILERMETLDSSNPGLKARDF